MTALAPAWHISELVPHAGPMRLVDELLEYSATSLKVRLTVRDDGMFSDPSMPGRVPAWVAIEYMAQAVAAHVGVKQRLAGETPRMGFLLGTRLFECNVPSFVPGTVLTISAVELIVSDQGLGVYDCVLEGEGVRATAKVNGFLPKDDASFWATLGETNA